MTTATLPQNTFGKPVRWGGAFGFARRIPVTLIYMTLLGLATWLLDRLDDRTQNEVVHRTSTNLDNLGSLHLGTLFTSAFVLQNAPAVTWWLAVGALLAGVELLFGSGRLAVAFLAGHVGATLLVAGGLATGVHYGWISRSVMGTADVGVSYGLMAVIGFAAGALPGRLRWAWAAVWLISDVAAVWVSRDFTSVGHLLALSIGLGLAALARSVGRGVSRYAAEGGGPTATASLVAAVAVVAGALVWGADLVWPVAVLVVAAPVLLAVAIPRLARPRSA